MKKEFKKFQIFLKMEERFQEGEGYLFVFPNNYSVHILRKPGSFGYENGKWETVVLHKGKYVEDKDNKGNLIEFQVVEVLNNVKNKRAKK